MQESRPLEPGDLLHFVELDEFVDDWQSLGFDVDRDLWDLQSVIMGDPLGAPVVSGTGGLRKLRFGKRDQKVGKSGGVRVLYAYFPKYWHVLLVMAYGKGKKSDLTPEEKSGIKSYLDRVERWLEERSG